MAWYSGLKRWLLSSPCVRCGTRHRTTEMRPSWSLGTYECRSCRAAADLKDQQEEEERKLFRAVQVERRRIKARRIAELEMSRATYRTEED